jgi:hypothetical protein
LLSSFLMPSERLTMTNVTAPCIPSFESVFLPSGLLPDVIPVVVAGSRAGGPRTVEAAVDPDDGDEDDLGDEEDLAVAQPLADEESSFEDFDDEFDDDFEEEENDPDWDHPDDGDNEPLPPGKGPGRKK